MLETQTPAAPAGTARSGIPAATARSGIPAATAGSGTPAATAGSGTPAGTVRSLAGAGTTHSADPFDLRRLAARQLVPLAVIGLLLWLTWDRITGLDTARIAAALATVGPLQWLAGLVLTAVSFWAVGRYDAVVHRLMGTGVSGRDAVRTGAAAIAVAQTLGMGTVTGAFVRWRLLPALGLVGAMRVSVIVTLSFLAGWAVLAAIAVLLVPLPLAAAGARFAGFAVLTAAAALAGLSLIRPAWLPARLGAALPSLKAMALVLGLAALDAIAAGTVLWILLPEAAAVAPAQVLAAYLLALGAGLVLTTPGGVGPFELALIALLPGVGEETLLAAVIAYRALYYATPAVIGGLVLLSGPRRPARPAGAAPAPVLAPLPTLPRLPFLVEAVIDHAPRAEAGLIRHGRLALASDRAGRPLALVAASGQSLVMLSDPLRRGADGAEVLATLGHLAEAGFRAPVLYKAGGRLAAAARRRGWSVLPVAREAWLDPRGFSTAGKARAGLRRKLRKAEAAGIEVTAVTPPCSRPLPLGEMAEVAADWAQAHGGERGFSMGRWDPAPLAWAHVFLARDPAGRLLGFVTLHANAREHTLDLMRAHADVPEGLMYLLVTRAIEAAGAAGVPRVSLAAAPVAAAESEAPALRALRHRLDAATGAGGLRQFKSAFAPRWEPLYIAAPGPAALAAGALDIAREIARPF